MSETITVQHISFIRKVLKKIPVFSRLSEDERRTLSLRMQIKTFKKGSKVIKKSETIKFFGIIWSGQLLVSANKRSLRSGDWFGEEPLVHGLVHVSESTIKCTQTAQLLCITQAQFSQLFSGRLSYNWRASAMDTDGDDERESKVDPNQPKKERRSAKAETFTAVSISQQQQRAKASYLKSNTLRKWLKMELKKNILFKSLSDELLDAIIDNLYCVEIAADTVLIEQGEMGTVMYIVEKGSIEVFIDNVAVTTMTDGECFGELSLMYDSPRAATCKTKTPCKLWCIPRNDFKLTLRRCAQKETETLVDFLKSVPILKLLSDEERRKIAERLNVATFGENEMIIREGDTCDDEMKSLFYILKKGKAAAYKQNKTSGEQVMVKSYGANEYFGERALITNEARAATIYSTTCCELLTLSRSEFIKTMCSVQTVIQRRMKNYEKFTDDKIKIQKQPSFFGNSLNSGILGRMFRSKPVRSEEGDEVITDTHLRKRTLSDFKVIHGIGQGSFATVWLVRDKLNKQTFALKRMSKSGVENTQQQEHVANERNTLSCIDCPFVIKLYSTFQDPLYVYMVLDLGLGGDMFTYLESEGKLSPQKARFFMGCVVLAFEYLHLNGMVYRDLKPENLVLDFRGYLKLCDLGFAKKLDTEHQRTYTVCGTPVYLAPEVIIGKGHSFAVDWWTSGVFLYEMITGYPPFDEATLMNTYDRILHSEPKFKGKYFKPNQNGHLVNLIRGLLNKNQNQRFGHSMMDINQRIKRHPWFDTLDWDKLANCKIQSPYRPKVKNDADTRYFDQDIRSRKNERVPKPKRPNAEWIKGF